MNKKEKTSPAFPSEACYIDSHCHLDMDIYSQDLAQVLTRAHEANIGNIITIGIDLVSSQRAVELARIHPKIFASIGVHPHDVENINEKTYQDLQNLYNSATDEVKAFGEIGLDYYKNYSEHSVQREHFTKQLALAQQLKLPVIIHNRDADDDCYDILKSFPLSEGGIMHCFGSDYTFAKKVLDLGMYISLSGVVTFKNATKLHEVAANIPLDRMLVETDGPFLAPVPFRGKRNEPAHVRYTVARIAELRGSDIQTVAEATTANAKAFFHIA